MKKASNVNNHMNINRDQFMILVVRRDWAGINADGTPATQEVGTPVDFLLSGVSQPRLAPKKGELDLWTVCLLTDKGAVVNIRLDFILAAIHATRAPEAPPEVPPQEGEFIPAAAPAKTPRKRTPAKG